MARKRETPSNCNRTPREPYGTLITKNSPHRTLTTQPQQEENQSYPVTEELLRPFRAVNGAPTLAFVFLIDVAFSLGAVLATALFVMSFGTLLPRTLP